MFVNLFPHLNGEAKDESETKAKPVKDIENQIIISKLHYYCNSNEHVQWGIGNGVFL